MILLGEIKDGHSAGSWCLLAEGDAASEEELTPEEKRKLDQARQDDARVTLGSDLDAAEEETPE